MDRKATLAAFDRQMRRPAQADGSGARIEDAGAVVRYVSADPAGWSAVLWSNLDEASADRVIAEQIAYFAGLGHAFEWKHYAYDRPADLPLRLRAAGLEPGAEEALLVAEVAALAGPGAAAALPPGVRLIEARDEASVGLVVRVHEEVFGVEHAWLGRALLNQLERAPDAVAAFVAMVGERPVSSARVEFHRGTDFASLWGGGTLPEFRGRGIYRALVAQRARLAAERGFRYLQVDALPTSRPTLERLGFTHLTTTTPYGFRPPGRER
jgi:ribosomal protein S18 acetylase RimI-like enzyme